MAQVSFYDARRARRSLKGRIYRLRKSRGGRWSRTVPCPINDIDGIFEGEIQRLENAYGRILSRVNSALENVTVEI